MDTITPLRPQNQLPPHHVSKNLKIMLLAFAIVLAAALGYLVWQQNHSSTDSKDDAITHPKKTVATTPATTDPTADWKTYTNQAFGFSVKYPATFTPTVDATNPTTAYFKDQTPPAEAGYADLAVTVKDSTLTLAEYLASLKASMSFNGEVVTTLDGQAAYEGVDLGILNAYSIIAVQNGKTYSLLFKSGNHETMAANKAALSATQKLMIASFNFL